MEKIKENKNVSEGLSNSKQNMAEFYAKLAVYEKGNIEKEIEIDEIERKVYMEGLVEKIVENIKTLEEKMNKIKEMKDEITERRIESDTDINQAFELMDKENFEESIIKYGEINEHRIENIKKRGMWYMQKGKGRIWKEIVHEKNIKYYGDNEYYWKKYYRDLNAEKLIEKTEQNIQSKKEEYEQELTRLESRLEKQKRLN